MQRWLSLLSLILFIGCANENETSNLTLDLPIEKSAYQRKIVGQLSGEYLLSDGTLLNSRWSVDERAAVPPYLKALLREADMEPIEQEYQAANLNPAIDMIMGPFSGVNIYGILPSTNGGSEYVILGAHYDTGKRKAPGADDNATGMALIYSVAKELSKLAVRNKNLVVVFFDQEEEELIGSRAFLGLMREQQWNIHSIHCFDMVGWDGDNDQTYQLISANQRMVDLYKEAAVDKGVSIDERLVNAETYYSNSTDYDVFIPEGYQVAGFGECFYCRDYSPYKDSKDDTFDKVNFNYLLAGNNLVEEVITKIITE